MRSPRLVAVSAALDVHQPGVHVELALDQRPPALLADQSPGPEFRDEMSRVMMSRCGHLRYSFLSMGALSGSGCSLESMVTVWGKQRRLRLGSSCFQ